MAARRDVGLLYIMWRHSTASSSRLDYLRQVLDSARAAKALNPALPIALTTNVRVPLNSSLDVVYTLSAPSKVGGALRAKWIFRLLAIAGSPFELTLAVDASVTVCSSRLHAAMQSEAILRNAPVHPNICAAMNERAPAWRMIAQHTRPSGYATHTTQRDCVQEVTGAVGNATRAAAPARVCRLLASPPAGALAELQKRNDIHNVAFLVAPGQTL